MPNLASPPAYRASVAALAVAAETARRLRRLDAQEDGRYPKDGFDHERAAMRLRENAEVRALAWTAHKRAYGVLGD